MNTRISSASALLFYSLLSIFGGIQTLTSLAHAASLQGNPPERGVRITINSPTANHFAEGAKASISGKITATNANITTKSDLLELFQKEGIEIHAYLPDATREVTSKLNLVPQYDLINFGFESNELSTQDLNLFTLVISRPGTDVLALLSAQAKIDVRVNALLAELELMRQAGAAQSEMETVQVMISELQALSKDIVSQISATRDVLAVSRHPLQVGNNRSAPSLNMTQMGGFKLTLGFDPGNSLTGGSSLAQGTITRTASTDEFSNVSDPWIAKFSFNGTVVKEFGPQGMSVGNSVSFELPLSQLQPNESHTFSSEVGNSGKRFAGLALSLPVIRDDVAPVWVPSALTQTPFIQSLAPLSLSVTDPFGTMNPASIRALIEGILADGTSFSQDFTNRLSITSINGNSTLRVQGDLNPLPEGKFTLSFSASDMAGNNAPALATSFQIDRTPPTVQFSLVDESITRDPSLTIPVNVLDASGATTRILHNGALLILSTDLIFSAQATLTDGLNTFEISSVDLAGNPAETIRRSITLDRTPPSLSGLSPATGATLTGSNVDVSGNSSETLSSITANGTQLNLSQARTSFSGTLSFSATGSQTIEWVATDIAGNVTTTQTTFQIQAPGGVIPPDPKNIAPPVNQTIATILSDSVQFIYQGANPIQTGVAPGTIQETRAAVIRGKVLNRDQSPLSGVRVSIKDHPEFGQTLSREDGGYDLVINGGGSLILDYQKTGFLPSQRPVEVAWLAWALVKDVVLVELDSKVTSVQFGGGATAPQIAQGTTVTDGDGTRKASLFFTPGTQAQFLMADGTQVSVDRLNIRATEYTVGSSGEKAMPGPLPATSAYTYAVELSADEAIAANAKSIQFSQPVSLYVDNFLNFRAGRTVPVGMYDREKSAWVPEQNGIVARVLSISGGIAQLDLDGSGTAANGTLLGRYGITDLERQQIASIFTAGQSFWRAQMTHFSPWDLNWPVLFPSDAKSPDVEKAKSQDEEEPEESDEECGSRIDCQGQNLGEEIKIAGTKEKLNYSSNRHGDKKSAYKIRIPLTTAAIPSSLLRVDLDVEIAGRGFSYNFTPQANLAYEFNWDGKDSYGRDINGVQNATIRIAYVYRSNYAIPAGVNTSIPYFGQPGTMSLVETTARSELLLLKVYEARMGAMKTNYAVGGWTLDSHHAYDPTSQVLYMGTGVERIAPPADYIASTIAGKALYNESWRNAYSPTFEGMPATQVPLYKPNDISVAPDGSFYIADTFNCVIRKVSPDGTMRVVAGRVGQCGSSANQDGIPALSAALNLPHGVTLGPDGSIYIGDNAATMIRKVTPDGIIHNFAGRGANCFTDFGANCPGSSDEQLAKDANLAVPSKITFGPDGNIYFASYANCVRYIAPDGRVRSVAATCGYADTLSSPWVNLAPRDNEIGVALYGIVFDQSGRMIYSGRRGVYRMLRDGRIERIASSPPLPGGGTEVWYPFVSRDGTLYISGFNRNTIYRVNADRSLTQVFGKLPITSFQATDSNEKIGDGDLASMASLWQPANMAQMPNGALLIADYGHYRIRKLDSNFSGFTGGDINIASADGSEIYAFDSRGRHLRTLDAMSKSVTRQFQYDSEGRLTQIVDAFSKVTSIERDGSGNPVAIIAPFGQRTTLTVQSNGMLATASHAGVITQMSYHPGTHLLASYSDPNGKTHLYTYDDSGRLVLDQDPSGGSQSLIRSLTTKGFSVIKRTALGRAVQYLTEQQPTGERKLNTYADGSKVETTTAGGIQTTKNADGSVQEFTPGPDPRFGSQVPLIKNLTLTMPSGLTLTTQETAALGGGSFFAPTLSRTRTVNGKTFRNEYYSQSRSWRDISAEGRIKENFLDNLGQVIQTQSTGITPILNTYDSAGRITSTTQADRVYTFGYNSYGFLSSLIDPLGQQSLFETDSMGRLLRQTFPGGAVVQYQYDAAGNIRSITPAGKTAHSLEYSPLNLQTLLTAPDLGDGDNKTSLQYSVDRELVRTIQPGNRTTDMIYHPTTGQLVGINTAEVQLSIGYDANSGKVRNLTASTGEGIAISYDGSLRTAVQWTGPVLGTVSYTYNNDFKVSSVSVNGANTVNHAFDRDGFLTQAGSLQVNRVWETGRVADTTLLSITHSNSYNEFGELTQLQANSSAGALMRFDYARDAKGRVISKTETINGETHTYAYAYSANGELQEVKRDGSSLQQFVNDSNGNRTSLVTPDGKTDGTYDAQDRVLTYGQFAYSYATNGRLREKRNTVTNETTTYQYDTTGNLRSVGLSDGRRIDYLVDPGNRRIGRKLNGALEKGWLYDGDLQIIAELDASGNIQSRFVYGTRSNSPDYMIKAGVTYRILSDHLGSPRLVVDAASGSIVQRMNWDAFGNNIEDTNPGFQPFGFAGGHYDPQTQLTHFGARDYDAVTGRWMSKDPLNFKAGDPNLYRYVRNDPMNLSDSSGLLDDSRVSGMIGCYMYKNGNDAYNAWLDAYAARNNNPSDEAAAAEHYLYALQDVQSASPALQPLEGMAMAMRTFGYAGAKAVGLLGGRSPTSIGQLTWGIKGSFMMPPSPGSTNEQCLTQDPCQGQ